MKEKGSCLVCGKQTRKQLLKDEELRIPICSYECEQKYLDTLGEEERAKLLTRFDNMITQTKHRLRLTWIAIGIGLLVTLVGFLAKTVEAFLVGVLLATTCAFLTRYFEERVTKLMGNRKRVGI